MKKIFLILPLIVVSLFATNSFVVCHSGCSYSNIQSAIDDLNNSKGEYDIYIKAGTYNQSFNIVNKSVHIIGEDATNTILDENGGRRAINLNLTQDDKNVTIENLQIKNGYADSGGAIYTRGGSVLNSRLTLRNMIFDNCSAQYGAGAVGIDNYIYVVIENCKFIGNHSEEGGALWTYTNSIKIVHSEFDTNSASGKGGALYDKSDKNILIDNSIFYKNSSGSGGALYTEKSVKIKDSWFVQNRAENGGGAIFDNGYSLKIENSILVQNITQANTGGAIKSTYGGYGAKLFDIESSNLIDNSTDANTSGDGLWIVRSGYKSVTIKNSILNNGENDLYIDKNADNNETENPIIMFSNVFGHKWNIGNDAYKYNHNIHDNTILVDANSSLFVDSQNLDFSLSENSILKDASIDDAYLPYDMVGTARPQGNSGDIGACEAPSICKFKATKKIVPVCTISSQNYLAKTVTIHVKNGWNLKSVPYFAPVKLSNLLQDKGNYIRTIWFWNEETYKWSVYSPDPSIQSILQDYSTLNLLNIDDTINVGQGFWIDAKSSFDFDVPVFITQ